MNGIPYRVAISPRPTGEDYAAVQAADLARARVVRADEVRLGDTVLADFPDFDRPGIGDLVSAQHFTDPYWATPQPVDASCDCAACHTANWTTADCPLVKLTDGFPWDPCDIRPATDLLLVAPYRCGCGCDTTLAADWSAYDWTTPASVQHLLETGRPLRPGEVLHLAPSPLTR
ncbi:hypothetical protein [Streptomyces javensis]|uniref:Uncharacterized protein n=1 Tax=Streptomyces javensis TaxID=114698 RepID=A0ABS0RP42_9ACTN|nr:hypothetical protein [Streptomyces javensis]MBI0319108.1 hypothetical protein [Streptomyces javensis]